MSTTDTLLLMVNDIAVDIVKATKQTGDISKITTTDKRNLVNAINELNTTITTMLHTVIEFDPASPTKTSLYSSQHFLDLLTQLKSDIEAEAPDAYNSLKKISDWVSQDQSNTTSVLNTLAVCLSFADAQNTTATQQQQGCANIGIGDPLANILSDYYIASDVNTTVEPGFVIPGYFK